MYQNLYTNRVLVGILIQLWSYSENLTLGLESDSKSKRALFKFIFTKAM